VEGPGLGQLHSRRPPAWHWVLLVSAIAFLVWILGTGYFSARVELLPFTDSPPAWNGSHPYSVVSMVDAGSDHVEFKSSIQDIAPTFATIGPVNEFEVDLTFGNVFAPPDGSLYRRHNAVVINPNLFGLGFR